MRIGITYGNTIWIHHTSSTTWHNAHSPGKRYNRRHENEKFRRFMLHSPHRHTKVCVSILCGVFFSLLLCGLEEEGRRGGCSRQTNRTFTFDDLPAARVFTCFDDKQVCASQCLTIPFQPQWWIMKIISLFLGRKQRMLFNAFCIFVIIYSTQRPRQRLVIIIISNNAHHSNLFWQYLEPRKSETKIWLKQFCNSKI